MIRDMLITIWIHRGTSAKELEEKTGIDREKWYALRNKRRRANEDDIQAFANIYPEFGLWLVSGNTAPEAGQISPEYEEANKNLKEQGQG